MSFTGPLFLSLVWKKYMVLHSKEIVAWTTRVRVLTSDQYFKLNTSFFDLCAGGNSWHGSDARFLLRIGQYLLLTIVADFSMAAILAFYIWLAYRRIFPPGRFRDSSLIGRASPRLEPSRGFYVPLWRRWSWRNGTDAYEDMEKHGT